MHTDTDIVANKLILADVAGISPHLIMRDRCQKILRATIYTTWQKELSIDINIDSQLKKLKKFFKKLLIFLKSFVKAKT